MYFSLLMLDEQIQLNHDLQELFNGNEQKLASMVKRGTAAESDLQNMKAERLNVVQQATSLESQKRMLQRMLSTFCGIEVTHVEKPILSVTVPQQQTVLRPEMRLFDAQLNLANAQEKALNSAMMPKLGLFAQGFYGYPGLNMFEDMMRRDYMTESNREVFLFNNNLEQIQQNEDIARFQKLMADDEEIITLRSLARHHRRKRPST